MTPAMRFDVASITKLFTSVAALRLTETALERGVLSARGFDRVLRMQSTLL